MLFQKMVELLLCKNITCMFIIFVLYLENGLEYGNLINSTFFAATWLKKIGLVFSKEQENICPEQKT